MGKWRYWRQAQICKNWPYFHLHVVFTLMGSRARTERSAAPTSEELQVWKDIRTQLQGLDSARNTSIDAYERLASASQKDTASAAVETSIANEQKCAIPGYSLTQTYIWCTGTTKHFACVAPSICQQRLCAAKAKR